MGSWRSTSRSVLTAASSVPALGWGNHRQGGCAFKVSCAPPSRYPQVVALPAVYWAHCICPVLERVRQRAHDFDVLHFHLDYYPFSLFIFPSADTIRHQE